VIIIFFVYECVLVFNFVEQFVGIIIVLPLCFIFRLFKQISPNKLSLFFFLGYKMNQLQEKKEEMTYTKTKPKQPKEELSLMERANKSKQIETVDYN